MTLTSKIIRADPLVMVNTSAKFDDDAINNLVSILFIWSKCERRTDGSTAALLNPLRNTLRREKKFISLP